MVCKNLKDISNLTFIHFGNSQLIGTLTYNPSVDFTLNKPKNVLWASPYRKNNDTKSAWEDYCLNHNLSSKVEEFVIFGLKSNSKILIIDKLEDLVNLDDKYIDKTLLNNKKIKSNVLNIENISNDYHGIYITDNGLKECSHIFFEWEVESLALFTTNIIVKLYLEQ